MSIPRALLSKIDNYEKQGYTPDEIIDGLAESKTYPDIAIKVNDYINQGYQANEIHEGIKSSPVLEGMDFSTFKSALLQQKEPTLPSYVAEPSKPTISEKVQPIQQPIISTEIPDIQKVQGISTLGLTHPGQEKAGQLLRGDKILQERLSKISSVMQAQPEFYKKMTPESVLQRQIAAEKAGTTGEVQPSNVDPVEWAAFIIGGGIPGIVRAGMTVGLRAVASQAIKTGLEATAMGLAQIPIGQVTESISESDYGKTHPEVGIALNFLANAATIYGVNRALTNLQMTDTWRKMTIPERNLVVQTLEQTKTKVETLKGRGFTETELRKWYPEYTRAGAMPTEADTIRTGGVKAYQEALAKRMPENQPGYVIPTVTPEPTMPSETIAGQFQGPLKTMYDSRVANYISQGQTIDIAKTMAYNEVSNTLAAKSQTAKIVETQKAETEKTRQIEEIKVIEQAMKEIDTMSTEKAVNEALKVAEKPNIPTEMLSEGEQPIERYNKQHLEFIRDRIVASGPPKRAGIGEETKTVDGYPVWFRNKGYTRLQTTGAIKNALEGEKLTNKQSDMLDDLIQTSLKEYEGMGKEDIYPADLAEGQKVIINEEVFTKEGTVLKDGEPVEIDPFEKITVDKVLPIKKGEVITPAEEPFLKPEEVKEPTRKATQKDMFTGAETLTEAMKGKIPTVDTPMTDLEMATQEAKARKIEAEMAKKQGNLADVGGYAREEKYPSIIEMPEITELAKELMAGKYPKIYKKLKAAAGQALGQFGPIGEGEIKLKAEIFKDPRIAAKVFSHEIGHLVDYLPEGTMARGNILGRIASLKKYMSSLLEESRTGIVEPFEPVWKKLTLEDRAKIRAEAIRQSKIAGGRIRANVSPDIILDIWRKTEGWDKELYDYVARLSNFDKKALMQKALSGVIPDWFKFKFSEAPEDVKALYRKLLEDEIIRRGLFKRDAIMSELKEVTQIWKPFDDKENPIFTKYRYSPQELYADAFSVLLNNPGLLQDKAPEFYRAFFNWMEAKPEVKSLYESIQDRLTRPEEVIQKRDINIEQMFLRGEEKQLQAQEKQAMNIGDILTSIKTELIDVNAKLIRKLKDIEKKGIKIAPEDNPRYWIEELPYTSSEVLNMLRDINIVKSGLNNNGISDIDIGKYMMLKRISTERAEMANPLGHTKETAISHLAFMKNKLGIDKFKQMEEGVLQFKGLRQKNVISVIEKSQMLDDEIIELIKNNENYAAFDVQEYIKKRYGKTIGARIYQQIGTLKEITNPFTATIMKDAAMLRAANRKMTADIVVKFLQDFYPSEITPSETRWNGTYNEPIDSQDPSKDSITFLHKGKIESFDVDKYIAKSFNSDPYEASIILKAFQFISRPLKEILVSKNPAWILWNIQRDIKAFAKQVPGADLLHAVEYAIKSIPDAYKDVFRNISTKDVAEMYKNKELIVGRIYGGEHLTETKQLDRLLNSYGENPLEYKNKVLAPFRKLWDWLDKPGQISERITKIAGHKFLRNMSTLTDKEIAHIIRTRAGSPDFKRAGNLVALYNNLFLFSNAGKEGIRTSLEVFKEKPSVYVWKTIKYDIIPKLLMYSAGIGLFGATIKKLFDNIPEHDKTNYMTIPLGETKEGKTVYFVMPHDFQGQLIAGITWRMLNIRKTEDIQQLADYTAGGLPYQGLHPAIGAIIDAAQYMTGKNPYDSFRGKVVVPEQRFTAGGWQSHRIFLKHIANNVGMASLIYRFPTDDLDRIKGTLENIQDIPIAGRIFDRFVRVSNRGKAEQYREISKDIRQKRAEENINIQDAIMDNISSSDGKLLSKNETQSLFIKLVNEGKVKTTHFDNFYDTYKKFAIKRYDIPLINSYMSAQSNEEKAALVQKYIETEKQEE